MQSDSNNPASAHYCTTLRDGIRFLAASILGLAISVTAQQQVAGDKQETKWETLENCKLMTNAVVDGDSFHVLHGDREYIFRLYFVDAPESDPALKERIKDQSAYFGVATDKIPQAGKLAAQFTRDRLTITNFTIVTRWQNAMGRSSLARFYAIVLIDDENLAEQLVANGLARIYGLRANWPDGPRSTTFINKLKNLELSARERKLGVWNDDSFPRDTSMVTDVTPKVSTTKATPKLVDINSATAEELDTLPGIGPVLAGRIIAHRPFKTINELDDVPGIGTVTLERLRPLIQIGGASPSKTDSGTQ